MRAGPLSRPGNGFADSLVFFEIEPSDQATCEVSPAKGGLNSVMDGNAPQRHGFILIRLETC
jgi:hypothetical protein